MFVAENPQLNQVPKCITASMKALTNKKSDFTWVCIYEYSIEK